MSKFKYETHLHTKETSGCARMPAEEIPELYKASGYDGVVVTDHYASYFFDKFENKPWKECVDEYLKGYRSFKEKADKIGLIAILGMELKFDCLPNDYLIYGFDEDFLYENPKLHKMNIIEFSELARKQGLLFIQAHPFRGGMVRENTDLLDGMEAFNGNPRHSSQNELAYEYALNNNLIMLAGSDFHQIEDLATSGIMIEERVTTSKDFAKYLLAKNRKHDLVGLKNIGGL